MAIRTENNNNNNLCWFKLGRQDFVDKTILGTRGFLSRRVEYLRVGTTLVEETSGEGEGQD